MSEFPISKELIKAAINESNCAIVDAFREFRQSGDEEISNNAEQLLNAAEFFQKLSLEQDKEINTLTEQVQQLRESISELIECKGILTSDKQCVIKAKQVL